MKPSLSQRLTTILTLVVYLAVYGVPRPTVAQSMPPTLSYQLIARLGGTSGNFLSSGRAQSDTLDLAQLPTLELENNRAAVTAQLSAANVAHTIELLPSNVPLVLGRYTPTTGDFVVDVYKVERTVTATGVYRASFTPAQGALWVQAGTYLDPALKHVGVTTGANPFAAFASSNDPQVFASATVDAAQVIVGHAMRYVGSPFGLLIVANPRTTQSTHTSGGLFRKTTTVTVKGYLQPHWFIAASPQFQPQGTSAAICADPLVSNPANCAWYMIAPAMVTFQEWQGGAMPELEDLVTTWSESKSGFTFAFFLVVAFAAGFSASAMLYAALGPTASASSAGEQVNQAAGTYTAALQALGIPAGASASPTVGVGGGSLYAGLSELVNGGSLTDVQKGYVGAVGNGVFTPSADQTSTQFGQEFTADSETQVINADPLSGGLSGTHAYYVGSCPASQTLAQCQANGQDGGVIPRADTYVELDATRLYQDTQPPN
jgi:hypothetical protein